MKLVAEIIKTKNQSADKYQGYLQVFGSKEKEICDPQFNKDWEVYVYNKVVNNLKNINNQIVEFDNSQLSAESQAKIMGKIMGALDNFDKSYCEYNKLMEYHKRAFDETILRVIADERRTLYNYLKKNKNNIIINSQLVLSKFVNTVKSNPMVDPDVADMIVSKMEESFHLSAERELYVSEKVSLRKHSHKSL